MGKRILGWLFLIGLLGCIVAILYLTTETAFPTRGIIGLSPSGTATSAPTLATPTPASPAAQQVLGDRTKRDACQIRGPLPDADCTPGAIFANASAADVCVSGYSSTVRDVPRSVKVAVFAEYGIVSHTAGAYEVDHLIPLELGGSNDIANLWPEAAQPTPGFHQKDTVENALHSAVCSGTMSLAEAQTRIAKDWLAEYR